MLFVLVALGLVAGTYGQCRSGFVQRPGSRSCYYFVRSSLNWFDADQYCTHTFPGTYNTHLVSIEDPTEQAWLVDRLRSDSGLRDKDQWTSGTRLDQPRGWLWARTYSNLGYTAWESGQPSGSSSRCILMRNSWNFRWGNYDCETDTGYGICEYNF